MACITSFLLLPTVITTSSRELSSPSSRAFCSSSNLYGRFEKQNGRRKGISCAHCSVPIGCLRLAGCHHAGCHLRIRFREAQVCLPGERHPGDWDQDPGS